MKTGKLTLKTDSVVHSIIYDQDKKKAVGVRIVDAHTKSTKEYFAKVIFLNASTLNTNLILWVASHLRLFSRSARSNQFSEGTRSKNRWNMS